MQQRIFGLIASTLMVCASAAANGPAPDFTLTSQDGAVVKLSDFRGKTVAVTFIFASCTDTCPLLTDKMARVQDQLGHLFGTKIAFISITVDP